MNKKLTAKTQYLNAPLQPEEEAFSKALSITPESDELLMKRGTIYTIFEVKGGAGYNTELLSKVVHDVLHDSYFQSDNISPIQSLEKSISEVRDKIAHLSNESIRTDDASPEFSMISGVLWGNVMYVVQYGIAQGYLVRDGEMKPINTISEGGFSAASGVVKDGDVIIFCSYEFSKKYPPNRLLSMAIGDQQLMPQESCILLKFILDTSFSQNEEIDFGLDAIEAKKDKRNFLQGIAKRFAKFRKQKPAGIKAKVVMPKKESEVPVINTISVEPLNTLNTISPTKGLKLKTKKGGTIKKPLIVTALLILALATSIFVTLKNKKSTPEQKIADKNEEVIKPLVEGAETKAPEPDTEVFYDLKIADPEASPNKIAVFNKSVVVSDNITGKIFASDQNTAKFEAEATTYVGIDNLINIKGKLGFTDKTGYKVYDLANQKLVEDYTESTLGTSSAYLDYVYGVVGDKIMRFSKSGDALEGSLWAQNDDFVDAKSITVAYSIYILTKNNNIEKYTAGSKNDFEISGIDKPLGESTQVLADIDFENIYVADKENGRVLSLSEKGKLVKEYKPTKEGAWKDLKSIGVSPDEKTMFVLSGSRVYKVSL